MALFNKKKLSLEEILNAIATLSEEEKAEIKAKMDEKPEVEEDVKAEETESVTEEQGVETPEETNEEVTETEGEEVETEEVAEVEEQPSAEEVEQPAPETDQVAEDNQADVIQGLTDRITALEEQLAEFSDLKALMEDFTKKQADNLGYKGAIPGAKKDIQDMSARELKEKMLNGEI